MRLIDQVIDMIQIIVYYQMLKPVIQLKKQLNIYYQIINLIMNLE